MSQELQRLAAELLSEGTVDAVLGYRRGSLATAAVPFLARTPADAAVLIFDCTCGPNLARFARDFLRGEENAGKRLAVVAKGCDGRALVQLIAEKQLPRERLYVLGVACRGVVDRHKLRERLSGRLPRTFEERGEEEVVATADGEAVLPREDILCDCCLECEHPTPPLHDALLGAPPRGTPRPWRSKLAGMDADARWGFLDREFARCIRCYACRNACPMCYCNDCFIDANRPRWFARAPEVADTMLFHAVRILHTAGRCVDCGACTRACPVGVDLRALGREVEEEVRERFGYRAGPDPEEPPALASFREEDAQEFIL